MSKIKLTDEDIRAINLLYLKGNNEKQISDFLHIPIGMVKKILKNIEKENIRNSEVLSFYAPSINEDLQEFVRIINKKVDVSSIGKLLYEDRKKKSRIYRYNTLSDNYIRFKFKNKYVGICASADWHLGHVGVDYDRLEKDLQIIEKTDNLYMMFLGDAIDNFIDIERHKEAIINADTSPKDQLYIFQYVMNFFSKPQKKILFVVKDNHVSHRLKRNCGVDYFNKLWENYGVFYGGEEVMAELCFDKVQYRLLARHEYTGKSKIHLTAAAKNFIKNAVYENIDIVALGHTHEGDIELFPYRGRLRAALQASTYKLIDPYADKLGFNRPEVIMPVLILNPYRRAFIVATDVEEASFILNKLNK